MADALRRVLIVDDEEEVCDILERFLGDRGYSVTSVLNAEQGLQILREEQFSLLLLDLVLPDADGLELIERIRDLVPTLPIVVLSGLITDREFEQEVLRKGASVYCHKTMLFSELWGCMEQAMDPAETTFPGISRHRNSTPAHYHN